MISVVLPVHNGEKFLSQSIESVLKQTYKNIELIIVNDCSSDSSLSIAERYRCKDNRIKIINNTSNLKLPISLNVGFNECRGEYFTWTSDDNVMLPNALEVMLSDMKKNDVDFVFSRCEIINKNGHVIGRTKKYTNLDEIYYNNIVLASFLYKRKVHEELGGYDSNKFLVEDYDFWLRAYKKYKFSFIPNVLYQIRFHDSTLGVLNYEKVKLEKVELLKENLNFVSDSDVRDCIYKEISNCYVDISNLYYTKLRKLTFRFFILKKRFIDSVRFFLRNKSNFSC